MGTQACRASVSTLHVCQVLPNFHKCFYNIWEHRKNVYKIMHRKLKCGNSLLYHSINSPYYAMAHNGVKFSMFSIQLYIRKTAFSQSEQTFSKIMLFYKNLQHPYLLEGI